LTSPAHRFSVALPRIFYRRVLVRLQTRLAFCYRRPRLWFCRRVFLLSWISVLSRFLGRARHEFSDCRAPLDFPPSMLWLAFCQIYFHGLTRTRFLCLDFSSILLLITGKTPLPIFSCATERLVPRRPRDSVSSYLPSRFVAPPDFVFVEQSRSLCGKEKHPGNKPRHPHRRSYFTASSLVAHAWKTLALSPRRQSSDFGLLLLIFL
jgi:hypothetical protein